MQPLFHRTRRDKRGRVVGTKLRVIVGVPEEVIAKLGGSTAYIERTHVTMRHMNGRLVRKGLGFSKVREMRQQHCQGSSQPAG